MKKIVLILAISVFAITFTVNASGNDKRKKNDNSNSVTGVVVDKTTGETLAGVTIRIAETNTVAVTDLDGKFTFSEVNPGSYQVKISYISYKEYKQEIIINDSKKPEMIVQLESR